MAWRPDSVTEAAEYYIGYLVFLIGLSLCFESVLLGLVFVTGSLFLIPYTRRPLARRVTGDVPRWLLVVLVCTSVVTPSMIFDDYETGTYFGTSEEVSVRVTSDGEWSGEISSRNSFRRIEGQGNATYGVGDNDGEVEAFAAKKNGTAGELTIAIVIGNETVATDTAGAGERRANVEHTIGIL